MGAVGLPHPYRLAKGQVEGKIVVRCVQGCSIHNPVMSLNPGDVIPLDEFQAKDLIAKGWAVAVKMPPPIQEQRPAVDKPEETPRPETRERATETRDTKPGKDFVKK